MGPLVDENIFRMELQRYYESMSNEDITYNKPLVEGYKDPIELEVQKIKLKNNGTWDPEGGYLRLAEITGSESPKSGEDIH